MVETVCKIIETYSGWDWSAIIQAVVSIWIAIVATLALYTWKGQSKAQRQADFLDTFTDSINDLHSLTVAPLALVKWVKVGMQDHADLSPTDTRLATPGAIAYIENDGGRHSKQLGELLDKCRPVLTKIGSLTAKGHVLGLSNYDLCNKACVNIAWQFGRIAVFSQVIGETTLNWDNPEVKATVDKALSIEPEEIDKSLEEQNNQFLEFVRTNYKAIYG